ncbi:exopolysaccharide biosynthesis polyprenyl glycosylphosphotransferase [Hydrogenimonas thermophila]|uniref:Undecaprenyl-phosphate galactose phosphotransferase n=1 Tax=Hydrogenimonas thermophila TaxID=223786 RepID=A0A1I5KTS2_9BACT|nr:exopolysaccharide biosynthesis polyprenyl glycosylphosphotransferase [Hydrogenimonas thermophila]SFO88016.1 undecaprenyl-phosphate galactose phosphotransferase [Hydrogenimonas thermophila]
MQKYILKSLLIISDIIWMITVFYIVFYIRQNLNIETLPEFSSIALKDFSFVIFIILLLFYYEKIYDFRFDFWQDTLKIFKSLVISFLIVFSILALTKTNLEFSRLFIILYFIIAFITFPFFKRFIKSVLFRFDYFKEKVLIIGKESEKKIFEKELKENWYLGSIYSNEDFDKVIILSEGFSIQELSNLIEVYLEKVSEIFIVPYLKDINFIHSNILEYSNVRLNTIQVQNKLLIKKNLIIKNLIDKIISLIILPFFILLHIFIFVLIKLDSKGSVFFKQKRLGKDGKIFEVYKYRTMYKDGDKLLKKYLQLNPYEIEHYKKFHKYQNDPRVTKVGKFLRTTSLDELPQIINVLKGEMNFVGPRPYMIDEEKKLGEHKELILKVKPGITGLWQVSGRNELEFKQRIELEMWYIKNWSIWADLVILMKTIKVVLKKTGAK